MLEEDLTLLAVQQLVEPRDVTDGIAGIRYRIDRRARPGRTLTKRERETNRRRSATRARGEHAFHVVKTLWGFAKVRYRGLMKNTVRAFAAFALANLYLARRTLLAT